MTDIDTAAIRDARFASHQVPELCQIILDLCDALDEAREKIIHQNRVIEVKDSRLAEAVAVGEHLSKRAATAEQRIEAILEMHPDVDTNPCGDPSCCGSLDGSCPECGQPCPCDTRLALMD